MAQLLSRAPQSEELDAAREIAVAGIESRNATIEGYNAVMKAKKKPGLELITTQVNGVIQLEEGEGFVYPGNGVLELLNLSCNGMLDGPCFFDIAEAIAKSAGMGESALRALAIQMTGASKDPVTTTEIRKKLGIAACKLEV